jgi:hypothetical protein
VRSSDPATHGCLKVSSAPGAPTQPQITNMPPPSQLSIATSSVQRLVKEEASYHKELEKQQARLQSLEANPDGDENAEYQLKQEVLRPSVLVSRAAS